MPMAPRRLRRSIATSMSWVCSRAWMDLICIRTYRTSKGSAAPRTPWTSSPDKASMPLHLHTPLCREGDAILTPFCNPGQRLSKENCGCATLHCSVRRQGECRICADCGQMRCRGGHEALAEISIAASSIANKLLPIQIARGGAKIHRSLLGCVDNSNILARIP